MRRCCDGRSRSEDALAQQQAERHEERSDYQRVARVAPHVARRELGAVYVEAPPEERQGEEG